MMAQIHEHLQIEQGTRSRAAFALQPTDPMGSRMGLGEEIGFRPALIVYVTSDESFHLLFGPGGNSAPSYMTCMSMLSP
jgi:hypothetical protein